MHESRLNDTKGRIIILLAGTEQLKIFFTKVSQNHPIPNEWLADMSAEKRDRIQRLKNENDKRLMATAHRLLCYALETVFGLRPSGDDWATGWHGKPYLKNAPYVHSNISHSGCVAMCAVHNTPVGVDIQRIDRADSIVAQRFMSGRELEAFDAAPDKDGMFYKIWTLKEAYVKYCGRGLGTGLQGLSIYPCGNTIQTNIGGCQFALMAPLKGYQAAACADNCRGSVLWVYPEQLF